MSAIAMTAIAMTATWHHEPVRFFQHLLRERDAIGLDPARLIDEARALGAGAYVSMGGGFSAWYPTRVAAQRMNPHLEGDFLGDVAAAARRAGIRLIVRMDISKGRLEWLEAHPDWFVRRADGTPGTVWEMPQTCPTGPVWQSENFAALDEILGRYPLDGFFYNYLNAARCYCDRCQTLVRAATGADIPPPGARTPAYERWRQDFMAAYAGRLAAFIGERAADAVLIPYHHVRDGWRYRAMAERAGMVSAQASNPLAVNPIDPQPQWNHWAAEEALAARAVKPDVAPVLIQTGSEFFASRQTAMPAGRLILNLIQAAAHRANTAPSLNGLLAQDDPRAVPALTTFGRYQAANAHWYRGLRPVARIAVIRSEDSLNWGPDAGRLAGHPSRPGHVAEFRGIYEMLVALRRPADIIPDGYTAAELGRYAAVILPAVSCLSDADAAALDAYVAAGGTLIATADIGVADEDGKPRAAPALRCLPVLPGAPRSIFGAYFVLASAPIRAALGGLPHIGADGDFWSPFGTAVPEGFEADLRLIGPFRNNAPEFTVVEGPGSEPGLIAAHGRGRVAWLPWRPGALHHAFAIPEYAPLLDALLTPAVGPAPIVTDAPAAVEAILYDHPDGAVLHLLNHAAPQGRALAETSPLAGFTVRIRHPATAARLLNDGTPLALARDGEDAVIRLDRLDTFAAVALLRADAAAAADLAGSRPA